MITARACHMNLLGALAISTALASCSATSGQRIGPPSAIIELRDGISSKERAEPTRVVVLGTGTPVPDVYRAGPGIAVIHKGQAYLFDVGAGTVRNAIEARYRYDLPALYPTEIRAVFLTHLHSDHTLDFVELNYTLWWRRRHPISAFGPVGLGTMAAGLEQMMQPDVRLRQASNQPIMVPDAYRPTVHEISEGIVFAEDDLTIEAFAVPHGDIRPAFGYRITTDDLSIVISGDTAISESLATQAAGVDLLFHEVISNAGLERNSAGFQAYHKRAHTTATELGELARRVKPGLLVLYHGLFFGVSESGIVGEVEQTYDGPVVLARDLDLFPLDAASSGTP